MRKLLVASQKSGVGKTTTALNLAAAAARAGGRVLLLETDPLNNVSTALNLPAHADRRPLRTTGINLPGIVCCDVVPGVDVFSPYEEGGCSDADLDLILQLVTLDAFRDNYDCLIINAPPFLGGRPAQLLAACDEYVVVLQAEPMAHRTMPAFTALAQRAVQGEARPAQLRGIVVILPESEAPGGRWERELKGRFGSKMLAPAVPYDGEVGKASLFNQVVVHASPEAPASNAFVELAAELKLTRTAARAGARSADAALSLAAAAVKDRPLAPRPVAAPAVAARKSSPRVPRVPAAVAAGVGARSEAPPAAAPPAPLPRGAAKTDAHRRVPTAPPRSAEPPAPPPRAAAAARPAPPSVRKPEPLPVAPSRLREADVASPDPALRPLHSTPRPYYIWIGLAVAGGIGLRFLELPSFALPIIVGLAVAAGVTLFLHLFVQSATNAPAEEPPAPVPTPRPTPPARPRAPAPPPRRSRRDG